LAVFALLLLFGGTALCADITAGRFVMIKAEFDVFFFRTDLHGSRPVSGFSQN
jgi:hypothetical protein